MDMQGTETNKGIHESKINEIIYLSIHRFGLTPIRYDLLPPSRWQVTSIQLRREKKKKKNVRFLESYIH